MGLCVYFFALKMTPRTLALLNLGVGVPFPPAKP